jgi:hypothetical protein
MPGQGPLPELALLLAYVTLAYDPRALVPSRAAQATYADFVAYLRGLDGPVFGPWQGQLPSGFRLAPSAHWVALEDLVRGPGEDVGRNPEIVRLTAPALHPAGPAYVITNQPLETLPVLAFLGDDYVLACDLGGRFAALRVLGKRYDHGWPRYVYRSRAQAADHSALQRVCRVPGGPGLGELDAPTWADVLASAGSPRPARRHQADAIGCLATSTS